MNKEEINERKCKTCTYFMVCKEDYARGEKACHRFPMALIKNQESFCGEHKFEEELNANTN